MTKVMAIMAESYWHHHAAMAAFKRYEFKGAIGHTILAFVTRSVMIPLREISKDLKGSREIV